MHTVVVDEVGYCYSEQGTLEACVQTSNALALDDALNSLKGVGVGLLGLDLRSGGERDQRVTVIASAWCPILLVSNHLAPTSKPLRAILLQRPPARALHCHSVAPREPVLRAMPKAHSVLAPAVEWQ